MKALALWEPWASAVALGLKRNETRDWRTSYRGPLAIHAAKRPIRAADDVDDLVRRLSLVDQEWATRGYKAAPYGCVVGVVDLVACLPTCTVADGVLAVAVEGKYHRVPEDEAVWGNYDNGRFAFVLRNLRRLREPVPFKGAQGFFDVPAELLAAALPPPPRLETEEERRAIHDHGCPARDGAHDRCSC